MPKLHTIYDIRNEAIFPWSVYLFFILMVLALLAYIRTRKENDPDFSKLKYGSLGAGILCFIIFLCCTAVAVRDHFEIKQIFDEKNYSVVEGRVQDYEPAGTEGHKDERFRVGDLHFNLDSYVIGVMGYNLPASQGGAIRANLYVRILYPTHGQIAILRLETE